MTSFLNQLSQELFNMKTELQKLRQDPVKPEKINIISKKENNKFYYYKGAKNKTKRTYLGGADSIKLKNVLASSYKAVLMEDLKENIKLLETVYSRYIPYNKEHVIGQLSPCVQDLDFINAGNMIMTELYTWMHEPYEKNPKEFPKAIIIAKDGTRVRSKSECIIYNALYDAGIPFRYDPVLKFRVTGTDGNIVTIKKSPDFQIKCPDGSEILVEHGGLLRADSYAVDLASKIQLYLTNGYIIGETLFVTSDDVSGGIDSAEIEKLIELLSMRFPAL